MNPIATLVSLLRVSRLLVAPLLTAGTAFAGVTVTLNTQPGATSWPGAPIVRTVSNPRTEATVGEGFGGSATSYTQTFTVPADGPNYTLEIVQLYAGGGAGTSEAGPVRLNLYDLGARTAPQPQSYAAGVNLFGAGEGLAITYSTQANGLLRLDFDGGDRVMLVAGHMYAFELAGVSGTQPLNWYRTISDTYAGGAAYRNRSWINGTSARDFALAVYGPVNTEPVPPTESTIDAATTHQVIDGFGAGVVFLDAGLSPLSDAQMDQLFGENGNEFGLSLLRVRISPTGNWNDALPNAQKARLRGARILASPWSPPAALKTNNNTVGGSLLPSQYGGYVDHLNAFIRHMGMNGAAVDVVSLQNEPDYQVTYESCDWTPEELRIFCRDFAGGIDAPVMMPESYRFNSAVSDPTLLDPQAAANVEYIGGHLYGASVRDYPLARSLGKPIWMTEYLINDQSLASALATAEQISACLNTGNMSAYIWWKCIGNANGLLDAGGEPQRRGFVMGQFSRFVRPGDLRIDVSANTSPLNITAFKHEDSGRFAIVAVNNTALPINHRFVLQELGEVNSVTPWLTSATSALAAQPAVPVQDGAFIFEVPAMSVVTFAGVRAPALVSPGPTEAMYGAPFSLPMQAQRAAQFSAVNLPPGLHIDPSTGLISGTPTRPGRYAVEIAASNDGGMAAFTLSIEVTTTALVRHLSPLSGGIDGSVHVLTAENVTLNGQAWVAGDLLVPGSPRLRLNGRPTLGGVREDGGAASPTTHTVTLNGGSVLSHLVQRVDPIAWPQVPENLPVSGTRDVTIRQPGDAFVDGANLRNLTLNANVGPVVLPPGNYGRVVIANGSRLLLGMADATAPSEYAFQELVLHSGGQIEPVGPVVLTLDEGPVVNGGIGSEARPAWFVLQVVSTDGSDRTTLNGQAIVHGSVIAPSCTVTINGRAEVHGRVVADRLVINGNGLLRGSDQ